MFGIADVYSIFFVLIAILLSFPALILAITLLLPGRVSLAHQQLSDRPRRSFFIGLIISFVTAFAFILGTSGGPQGAIGFAITIGVLGISTIGIAGLVQLLVQRLRGISDGQSEFSLTLRGAAIYEFAALVPVVGWFLFLPIAVILTVGTGTLALFGRRQPSPTSAGHTRLDGEPTITDDITLISTQ